VDVLREKMSPTLQAWIELYGTILLLVPFVLLVLVAAVPFVIYSFNTGEVSEAPGGLPFRWFIKSFLVIGFLLLLLSLTARLSRVFCFLFSWPGERK
jgi:TRAP-type mannitol/chloroaromatic compound transport system permease small subunit